MSGGQVLVAFLAMSLGFLLGFMAGAIIGRGALRRELQDAVVRRLARERREQSKGRRGSARAPRRTTPAELVEVSARTAAVELKPGAVVMATPRGLVAWLIRAGAPSRRPFWRGGWGR